MAARFWVGGTGAWNSSNTANWSVSSGGPGGASVPGSGDTVTIDANSGTGTCTMAALYNPTISSITFIPNNFTLDLNNNNLTCVTYSNVPSPSTTPLTARVIAFGATGQITVTGNNSTVAQWRFEQGLTYTGSKKFVLSYSGSVGTRTVSFPSYGSSGAAPNIYVTGGSDTISGTGSSGIVTGDANFTGFSGKFQVGQWFIYGNLTMSSTMTPSGTPVGALYGVPTSGSYTFTTNGAPWTVTSVQLPFTGAASSTWTFTDANLTIPNLTFGAGTLDLSTYNPNVTITGSISSSSGQTRILKWGTGSFTLTGANTTIMDFGNETNMSFTGTPPVVQVTANGTTGQTRTINLGTSGGAYNKSLSFNTTQGNDTVSMNGGFNNLTFQPTWTGILGGGSKTIYGNMTFHPAMTHASSVNSITFAPQGSNTIVFTTAGVTINSPIVNATGATTGVTKISGNLIQSVANTNTLTQSLGTLDIGNNTVNTWSYTANIAGVHGLTSNGSATMNLTGSNAVVANVSMTNWTMTGNLQFNLVGNPSSGTRTIAISNASSNVNNIDINVRGGTDNVTFTGSALDVDFTGFSGTLTQSTNMSVFGNMVMSNTMSVANSTSQIQFVGTGNNTIRTNNTVIQMPIGFNSTGNYQLQDNVTLSGFLPSTYSIQYNGNLDLNNNTLACPSWQISGGRGLNFGNTGQMILTGNSGTLWSAVAITTFLPTGNVNIIANTGGSGTRTFMHGTASGLSENNDVSISVTSGTDTLSFGGGYSNIGLTGWVGTWSQNQNLIMYGNLAFPANTITSVANGVLTLGGNSKSYSFDTNDVCIKSSITVNAPNSTITWPNDVVTDPTTLTFTAGNLVVNGNVTFGNVILNSTGNAGVLNMGNGTWTISGVGNVWTQTSNISTTNIVPGNSTLIFANDSNTRIATFANGTNLNNVNIQVSTPSSIFSMVGNVTLNTLSSTASASWNFVLGSGNTYTMQNWGITGSANNSVNLVSTTGGIPHNLVLTGGGTVNTVDWLNIQDSNASPGNTWYAGNNSVDLGGVTGWIFPVIPPVGGESNFFLLF
jgi:hypothetical protein